MPCLSDIFGHVPRVDCDEVVDNDGEHGERAQCVGEVVKSGVRYHFVSAELLQIHKRLL